MKLRVIEFELEGANSSVENSIRQLATAITSRTNGTPKAAPPAMPPRELAVGDTAQEHREPEELEPEAVAEENDAPSVKTKTLKPKAKPKPPVYLHDLIKDVDGFKAFAKEKAPESKNQQYLVAMYWLKEHGGSPTANADKIYTCFKTAGWSTGFNDWGQPFHNHVFNDHIRKVAKGEFAINPTGEEVAKALNKA